MVDVNEAEAVSQALHHNYPAPPHSFALWLDDELALKLRERHDANDLYQRAEADRAHLARWFGWAREFDRDSIFRQVVTGLDQFVSGTGWHADLYWRGECAGALWLHYLDREGGSTEIGYWLSSSHEGKGLVTRAVRGLLRHFFVDKRLGRVAIALDPRNERSLAVVNRLGLESEAVLRRVVVDADGAPGDLAFYGILKEEWERGGGGPVPTANRRAPARFALCLDREQELYLALFEREDASELARLVAANEAHLRPWMPWVDGERPASQLAFIESRALPGFASADGFECAIVRDGAIIGAAGVHDVHERTRRGSIGYWIDAGAQGSGYVTKAVAAIVDRCFSIGVFGGEPFERLDIHAEVDNLKSRAVPERLGFTFEGVLRRHRHNGARYADFAVYSLLRGEYMLARASSAVDVPGESIADARPRSPMVNRSASRSDATSDPEGTEMQPDERREQGELELDDALDDSFPASDPPSHAPKRPGPDRADIAEREAALDDALDDSFPASDPPSHTPPRTEDG
ncbi:MAG TPA: GNAT family protein [Trueperaceae bacterium]|nr:GNAT family protein [Trueperaceae bacterium]